MFERGTPEIDRPLHGAPQLIRPSLEALRLKKEMLDRHERHDAITLRKADGLNVLMIVLDAGAAWEDTVAPAPTTITVLEGGVRVSAAGKTVEVSDREIVGIDAHVPHKVVAVQDAILLVHVGPKPPVS